MSTNHTYIKACSTLSLIMRVLSVCCVLFQIWCVGIGGRRVTGATSSGLFGFDCSHRDVKVTPISLAGVELCSEPSLPEEETVDKLQLLQTKTTTRTMYRQCAISYTETIYHCGMHSHMSVVQGGLKSRYRQVSNDECVKIHNTRTYIWDHNHAITNIPINSSLESTITAVGQITPTGQCTGAFYYSDGIEYQSVVSIVALKVVLRTGLAMVDMQDNTITLPNGGSASYKAGHWFDLVYGDTYWNVQPTEQCTQSSYQVLYEGGGKIYYDKADTRERKVVVVESGKKAFALEILEPTALCSMSGYTTEHPTLYIAILSRTNQAYFKSSETSDTLEVSLASYINAKFVYVERHVRTQLLSLYRHFRAQTCEIKRLSLLNTLSLATINEEEFAYAYKGKKGYTATRRGEVIYLIECIPVPVVIRRLLACFSDLPVWYNNQSAFLSPKTGIIKKTGTEIECSSILPSWFYLHDGWYTMTPGAMTGDFKPLLLSPNSESKWTYKVPSQLGSTGIYTEEELSRFEKSLMFPGEKQSILNVIAQGVSGRAISNQGLSISKFVSVEDVQKIGDSILTKMWGIFSSIGRWTSGLLGIWVIYKLIKTIINTLINGHTLYSVFGFSFKLLCCIWTSLTTWALRTRAQADKEPSLLNHPTKCDDVEANQPDTYQIPSEGYPPSAPIKPLSLYPPHNFVFTRTNE